MTCKGSGLLGLGLDGEDGHRRITRGENLLLLGGSEETHERMQEHAMKLNEELERRGKTLKECSVEEAHGALQEVMEQCQ